LAPSLRGQVDRHRLGIAPRAHDLSGNFDGHEQRMQAHEARVASYYRLRPCAEGAEQFTARAESVALATIATRPHVRT
jgi:hypothetical protein